MVVVTDHAILRARKRCGIKKKAVEQLANNAFFNGLSRSEAVGNLKKYLDFLADDKELHREHNAVDSLRVYGNYVWLFAGEKLVTVLDLPGYLRNSADAQRRRKDGRGIVAKD
jgi:hypothetical protein